MDESYLEWLIGLPGFGEAKARRVAERFPSLEQLRAATREELTSVPGVTSADLETLLGLLSDGSERDASGELFLCPECGSFVRAAAKPTAPTANAKGVVKDFLTRWQRMAQAVPALSEADRLQEELEHYDRLIEADGTLERAWVNRARILEKLGRPAEAADSLSKAADLNPTKDDEYRLEVQNILRSTADASALPARWRQPAATAAPKVVDTRLVEALSHYDSLLRADPSLVVAWRTKGEILDRLGRPDEARDCFDRADRLEQAEGRALQAAVSGLRSRGLATSGPAGGGHVNGRVNGTG